MAGKIIPIGSSKGGSAKTTTSIVVASTLAKMGAEKNLSIAIIDTDPNQHVLIWHKNSGDKLPENISVFGNLNDAGQLMSDEEIDEKITDLAEEYDFVFVDLEGTASTTVVYAIMAADFVLVPMQGSVFDATETAKVIQMISSAGKKVKRNISYKILKTRTSPAIRPLALKNVEKTLTDANIPTMTTELFERAAFKDVMDFGGDLYGLPSANTKSTQTAIANAEEIVKEMLTALKAA